MNNRGMPIEMNGGLQMDMNNSRGMHMGMTSARGMQMNPFRRQALQRQAMMIDAMQGAYGDGDMPFMPSRERMMRYPVAMRPERGAAFHLMMGPMSGMHGMNFMHGGAFQQRMPSRRSSFGRLPPGYHVGEIPGGMQMEMANDFMLHPDMHLQANESRIMQGFDDVEDRRERAPTVVSFPMKLHKILADPQYREFIAWMPHGRAWRVLKPKGMEERVIPKFFRSEKYASFMRQVNGWGFKRIAEGPDLNAYWHEMFLRGLPDLCAKMRRPLKGQLAGRDLCQCPDFYRISMIAPVPDPELSPTTSQINEPDRKSTVSNMLAMNGQHALGTMMPTSMAASGAQAATMTSSVCGSSSAVASVTTGKTSRSASPSSLCSLPESANGSKAVASELEPSSPKDAGLNTPDGKSTGSPIPLAKTPPSHPLLEKSTSSEALATGSVSSGLSAIQWNEHELDNMWGLGKVTPPATVVMQPNSIRFFQQYSKNDQDTGCLSAVDIAYLEQQNRLLLKEAQDRQG